MLKFILDKDLLFPPADLSKGKEAERNELVFFSDDFSLSDSSSSPTGSNSAFSFLALLEVRFVILC